MAELNVSTSENCSKRIYSRVKKGMLKKQIERINDKVILANIFIIIEKYNANIRSNITENSNGTIMLFNSLNNDTYPHIEKYVNEYEKKRRSELSEMNTSDDFRYSTDTHSEHNDYINSKLKYSNKEKMLIRRYEYEEIQTVN